MAIGAAVNRLFNTPPPADAQGLDANKTITKDGLTYNSMDEGIPNDLRGMLLADSGGACGAGCPGGVWDLNPTSGWAAGGYFGGGVTLSRQTLSCASNSCSCQIKSACYGGGVGVAAGVGVEGGRVRNAPTTQSLNGNSKVLTITGGPVSVNLPLSNNANATWGVFKSNAAGVFYQNCSSTVVSCGSGSAK